MRPATREGWKIISITAHRTLTGQDRTFIRAGMKLLVQNPTVDAIYVGGARGGDTIALQAAAEFRKGSRPQLVVVCPDTEAAQPFQARQWFHLADEVIELGNPITREDGFESYRIRNKYLVDHCTTLVAFYNGDKDTGTGHAVQYAESLGVVVRTVPIVGR